MGRKRDDNPTAAALRMRLVRLRRDRGDTVVTMLIGQAAVNRLVERGLLDPGAAGDANAVTSALSRHLRDSLFVSRNIEATQA
jgi:hypothetical protein